MSSSVPAFRFQGDRLDPETALDLVTRASIHDLCEQALQDRTRRFQNKAFWVYNQHLNFTNICQNACRFCAFSKRAGEEGGYTYSLEDAQQRIRDRIDEPITEIHIVGGLNPELPYEYYLDLIRTVKKVRPDASVKAFTAVEVSFLAETYGLSIDRVLTDLQQAGLDGLPGGGAEVFSPKLRKQLCPEKISGEQWLAVHEQAHRQGIPSNATMLFGHVESWEDRIDHLEALRSLQDRTNGFLCFIPLPYQPGNNPLGAAGPDGLDTLKFMALSRLYLDNIPHLKAYWAYMGLKMAQLALAAGADDLDGTIVQENIGHAAGASSPRGLTVDQLQTAIRQAGFEPVQRNTLFQSVSC